ncbi:MAG TPA: hypothetical protein VFB16_09345 [Bauldia sp.]|nr:hypothetical protein [Bauldia sp.]
MTHILRITACLAFVLFAFEANAVVPSHVLKGTHSVSSIEMACIDASGQFFNTANGGYGCATGTGTVTCTNKGKCTGTCSNCAARTVPDSIATYLAPARAGLLK